MALGAAGATAVTSMLNESVSLIGLQALSWHITNLASALMVFEPATLKLHLAIGEIPASRGKLRTLDLAPLFKGE